MFNQERLDRFKIHKLLKFMPWMHVQKCQKIDECSLQNFIENTYSYWSSFVNIFSLLRASFSLRLVHNHVIHHYSKWDTVRFICKILKRWSSIAQNLICKRIQGQQNCYFWRWEDSGQSSRKKHWRSFLFMLIAKQATIISVRPDPCTFHQNEIYIHCILKDK